MNRDQQRATRAFAAARQASAAHKVKNGEYLSLARDLPTMLQTNGLLATWAFLLAKAEKNAHSKAVVNTCLEHLREAAPAGTVPAGSPKSVFEGRWLGRSGAALSGSELRGLTAEAVAFAGWLKRAAETLLSGAADPPPEPGKVEEGGQPHADASEAGG